jgi:stalled ribosome rescue protein Dom34
MQNHNKLGVYLDHSKANLFNFGTEAAEFLVIESEFEHKKSTSERQLHNRENQLQRKYYEDIGDAILDFNIVLLFGPTDAKTELQNYLSEIKKFGTISITTKTTDKLMPNQQIAIVNNFFSEPK